jgi:hypothetical protein
MMLLEKQRCNNKQLHTALNTLHAMQKLLLTEAWLLGLINAHADSVLQLLSLLLGEQHCSSHTFSR